MTTETTFLGDVPFPLLAPLTEIGEQKVVIPLPQAPGASSDEKSTAYQSILESMVDLSQISTESNNSAHLFAAEFGLNHIFGNIFHSSLPTTPLRVAALHRTVMHLELPLIRFSRQTAAWVWGYLPATEIIHMDFDKTRRVLTQEVKNLMVVGHQINCASEQDVHQWAQVQVTSPLRTVIDLLQFENEATSKRVANALIDDATLSITADVLLSIVKNQRYLQNRDHCIAVVEELL